MSRELRSGRNYDASKAPDAPERCTKKHKASAETERNESKKANKSKGEQAIVPMRRGRLTFGTVPGDASGPGECAVVGTGKQRDIALARNDGVKLSPAAYVALTHRAPPIRRVLSWPLPMLETHMIAEAPADREATSQQSVEDAKCVPVELVAAPGSAKCAPAAIEVPTTPTTTTDSLGAESGNDVYVTARASHVRDKSMAPDENGCRKMNDHVSETPTASSKRKRTRHKSKGKAKAKEPNVSTGTESTGNQEGLTWDEEVRRTTGEDPYTELYGDLPDISEWRDIETDRESIQVNALIYEVNENYVFDNDEYAAILRNLRTQEETESSHSQTRGGGPSRSHHAHHVKIEGVDDESEGTIASRTESYVGKGKGKSKPKKKSKKHKRPSLGIALDDLKGPRDRLTKPRETANTSFSYHGAGYLEGIVASTPVNADRSRGRSKSKRARTPPRDRRLHTPPSPSVSADSEDDNGSPMHRSSSGGSSDSSESSDSEYTASSESRTISSGRSAGCGHGREDYRRLKKMFKKLKKQNKRLEKKQVTQARSGYKAQTPKTYKGNADIDKYDIFMFGYGLFVDDTKLSDSKAVLTVSRFLEDKAAAWYMLNVAPAPADYTLEAVYIGLYNYCFPPNFKGGMRKLYNEKKQGDSGVQDYFA
ncbi:hypothetical protein FRC11_013047, partial [Ceratobasidium sp. 423]